MIMNNENVFYVLKYRVRLDKSMHNVDTENLVKCPIFCLFKDRSLY